MTCKEAVESGTVPNKFVAYYLGILTEFYEKTGIDIQKVDLENWEKKKRHFMQKLHLILRLKPQLVG